MYIKYTNRFKKDLILYQKWGLDFSQIQETVTLKKLAEIIFGIDICQFFLIAVISFFLIFATRA